MKLVTDKNRQATWAYDLRVRERLIGGNLLDPKTVERYLAELPDLEAHAENLQIEQPALGRNGDGGNGL
jgi:type II secretory pathway component PulK